MVSVAHFSTPPQTELIGKMMEIRNNKIPHYAENYKKEYLFIRGINKEIVYLINKLNTLNEGLFESKTVVRIKNIMKDFLRGQEKGKLKNISGMILPSDDFFNLININHQFDLYKQCYDAFCDCDSDSDSDDGDGEYLVDGKPYPGFIEFYDIFNQEIC